LTGKAIEACFHTQEQKMEQLMKELPQDEDLDLGESEADKKRRASFMARHAKNIAKGKMSAAFWAAKEKW
jgi:hypothetical protein